MRDAKAWAVQTESELKNEREKIYTHIVFKHALEKYKNTVSITKKGSDAEITTINFFLKNMKVNLSLSAIDKMYLVEWREQRLGGVFA